MADGSMTFRDIGQDCLASAMRLLCQERLTEESLGDPEDRRVAIEAVRQRFALLSEVQGALARYVVTVDDRARKNDWCDLRLHVRVDGGTALTLPVNVYRTSSCPQPLLSARALLFAFGEGDAASWQTVDAIDDDDMVTTYRMIGEARSNYSACGDCLFLIIDDLDSFSIEVLSLFAIASLEGSEEHMPFIAEWPPQRLAVARTACDQRNYIYLTLLETRRLVIKATESLPSTESLFGR